MPHVALLVLKSVPRYFLKRFLMFLSSFIHFEDRSCMPPTPE
jgi:hypothetical protein